MKKLFLLSFFFVNFISLNAQNRDYVSGQVLVSLLPTSNPSNLIQKFETWRGKPTHIRIDQQVSDVMNIWLLTYDSKSIDERTFLDEVKKEREVRVAQFNHYISFRKSPNDPSYNKQWQWKNTGQNGGTPNADIKAEEAWNITTGGLTPTGDTIVVAIIDSGIDHNHPDLKDNIWYNHLEIPNNQIDDDGNGYVDDYRGWNPQDKSDNTQYTSNNHGSIVAGMVGAKGDNGVGVTGVNWNVKIMMIKSNTSWMLDNSEVNVIASYAYALKMRKLYNETNGKKGAFIVSTNASWGIDNGKPSDSPLWCNLYDTLGVYGILNCGATSNSKINVDVVGDLPTTCPSEYLVAVQASDNKDNNSFSGYGVKNIDLAAPGDNIFSTSAPGSYTSQSGTSFATPIVAGAIALMYAAPSKIMDIAKKDPSQAALMMREALLKGVDVKTTLETQNATKGRLNLYNAVQGITTLASDCAPPSNLILSNIDDKNATISFAKSDSVTTVNLYYKIVGAATWTQIKDVKSPYNLVGLNKCTDYSFYLESICKNGVNNGFIKDFKTLGCCEAPLLTLLDIKNTSVSFSWNSILGAQKHELRYRKSGTWISAFSKSNTLTINNLDSCTSYEVQIRTLCDTSATATTSFSSSLKFKTVGCGVCLDLTYCTPSASAGFEWIKKVKLNTLSNTSNGSLTGYVFNSTKKTALNLGSNYTLELTPGYAFATTDVHFMAWLDLNQDGDFNDDGELLYDAGKTINDTTLYATISIPWSAKTGSTRFRVGMRAVLNNDPVKYSPCDNSNLPTTFFGEFEDYCINMVTDFIPCGKINNFKPIVSEGKINMNWDAVNNALGYDVFYRILGKTDWTQDASLSNLYALNSANCLKYEVQVRSICESDLSEFTPIQNINSFCTIATNDVLVFENISIYPNPFENQLNLDFAISEPESISVDLINSIGQTIIQIPVNQYNTGSYHLNIDQVAYFPKGIYYIKMKTKKGNSVRKVVK